MKGCISYSLFGYGQKPSANCFEFNTYLRGLMTNVRVNRVLYPGWEIIVNMDANSYNSPFKSIFNWLSDNGLIKINLSLNGDSLCLAMLRRLAPAFFMTNEKWTYSHVLCRDIDSIGTYRERQAVDTWVQEDKTIHCITDSISHNIPMMGGMIGVRPDYFTMRMDCQNWDELMQKNPGIDFNRKGSDQDFLNRVVYPKCADSSTEHFVLGMKQNIPETGGRHYSIEDIGLIDVDCIHRSLNDCAGHIGASGYYEPPMIKWLNTIDPFRDQYDSIERQFPQLFFWRQ